MSLSQSIVKAEDEVLSAMYVLKAEIRTQANIREDFDMKTKILMMKIERFLEPSPADDLPWGDPDPFADSRAKLLEEVRQWLYS